MIRWTAFASLCLLLAPFTLGQEPKKAPKEAPAEKTETDNLLSVEDLAAKVRKSSVVITHTDREGEAGGTGSGFAVSKDGLIATCAHVIGEGRPLTVRFDDGREHKVTSVHAWDSKLDLAILRIDARDLEPVPLALADSLVQGAEVVAMGAPHGLEFSVVRGVVSALRDFEGRKLIQIAIPIEPGNSGGPLLDREGRVHGLLTMKSAVTDNLGFAVPVGALQRLIAKPNPVPMEKWLTIGKLDPKRWTVTMGADWKQRAGRISVRRPGKGFGGRSLCLSGREVPEVPYEVAVDVLLDDEAGAAGLVFASDGKDRHYGFYPSGGRLRLTRFDGADVFSWTILGQFDTKAYRPGEWNRIRARIEEKKIIGFVNGEKVVELEDTGLRGGKVGLAKFRRTVATFRRFRLGADVGEDTPPADLLARIEKNVAKLRRNPGHEKALASLVDTPDLARSLLRKEAEQMRARADELDARAIAIHRRIVARGIAEALKAEEEDGDGDGLLRAALGIAKLDNPEVEIDSYLEEVERMAGEISASLPGDAKLAQKVEAIRSYLFRDNGYHGSRAEYYSRSNSYLNEVIDDREGIPITLSLLFVELGRRLDAKLHGLGLPGHFVAFYEEDGKRNLIDPFEGGVPLPHAQADALLASAGFAATAAEMPAAKPREIISRMLRNLKGIAIEQKDFPGALSYVEVLLSVNPEDPHERMSRALLNLQTGDVEQAKPDLEWLLEKEPEDLNIERIRELYERLE